MRCASFDPETRREPSDGREQLEQLVDVLAALVWPPLIFYHGDHHNFHAWVCGAIPVLVAILRAKHLRVHPPSWRIVGYCRRVHLRDPFACMHHRVLSNCFSATDGATASAPTVW